MEAASHQDQSCRWTGAASHSQRVPNSPTGGPPKGSRHPFRPCSQRSASFLLTQVSKGWESHSRAPGDWKMTACPGLGLAGRDVRGTTQSPCRTQRPACWLRMRATREGHGCMSTRQHSRFPTHSPSCTHGLWLSHKDERGEHPPQSTTLMHTCTPLVSF